MTNFKHCWIYHRVHTQKFIIEVYFFHLVQWLFQCCGHTAFHLDREIFFCTAIRQLVNCFPLLCLVLVLSSLKRQYNFLFWYITYACTMNFLHYPTFIPFSIRQGWQPFLVWVSKHWKKLGTIIYNNIEMAQPFKLLANYYKLPF